MTGSDRPPHSVSVALQADKGAHDYARLAVMIEKLGFDGVSVFHDFGFQPSFFPLLIMARETRRLRLGAACLNPFLLHPIEIAGQVAALDLASSGRAYLGLARGAWLDRVCLSQDRSLRRMAETIEIVGRLLSGDESAFAGEVFQLAAGTRLNYQRVRDRVDVLLGTWGPRGIRLAAQRAEEVKLGGCANPDMVRLTRQRLDAECRAIGRKPAEVGIVVGAVTVVDEQARIARIRARTEVAMYLDVVATLDVTVQLPQDRLAELRRLVAAGAYEEAGRVIPDDLLDRFCFSGTPSQIANHAAAMFEAGASRVEFGTPHGITDDHGIELLGTQVLPALRGVKVV